MHVQIKSYIRKVGSIGLHVECVDDIYGIPDDASFDDIGSWAYAFLVASGNECLMMPFVRKPERLPMYSMFAPSKSILSREQLPQR